MNMRCQTCNQESIKPGYSVCNFCFETSFYGDNFDSSDHEVIFYDPYYDNMQVEYDVEKNDWLEVMRERQQNKQPIQTSTFEITPTSVAFISEPSSVTFISEPSSVAFISEPTSAIFIPQAAQVIEGVTLEYIAEKNKTNDTLNKPIPSIEMCINFCNEIEGMDLS